MNQTATYFDEKFGYDRELQIFVFPKPLFKRGDDVVVKCRCDQQFAGKLLTGARSTMLCADLVDFNWEYAVDYDTDHACRSDSPSPSTFVLEICLEAK